MEHYDVIIIGAGIAGCGLAYNLKRIGYKGKVLVLDGKSIGENGKTGYRIIAEDKFDAVKEYGLQSTHYFKGVKLGVDNKPIVTIGCGIHLVNYKNICQNLEIVIAHDIFEAKNSHSKDQRNGKN